MTDFQIIDILSQIQVYLIVACCMICFCYSKKLNKPLQVFAYYLFFLMIINSAASKMSDLKTNNMVLTHFLVLGEFIFLSFFFKKTIKDNKLVDKYFKVWIGSFGGLVILNSMYLEALNSFNTNAKILVLFLIIFLSTSFFYDRSKKLMEVDSEERALRIINSALLLYYSGSFFVYLFYKFTTNNEIFYSNKMMIFNAGLYLIFTIIVFIAILQVVFYRKKGINNINGL